MQNKIIHTTAISVFLHLQHCIMSSNASSVLQETHNSITNQQHQYVACPTVISRHGTEYSFTGWQGDKKLPVNDIYFTGWHQRSVVFPRIILHHSTIPWHTSLSAAVNCGRMKLETFWSVFVQNVNDWTMLQKSLDWLDGIPSWGDVAALLALNFAKMTDKFR